MAYNSHIGTTEMFCVSCDAVTTFDVYEYVGQEGFDPAAICTTCHNYILSDLAAAVAAARCKYEVVIIHANDI